MYFLKIKIKGKVCRTKKNIIVVNSTEILYGSKLYEIEHGRMMKVMRNELF